MRLVVGLFAMFLTASVARADEAKAPDPQPVSSRSKMPLRVVRVLAESHQALLYDKIRGTHVLAEVGGTVGGYEVVEIAEDEVTLYANGREFVLAAPADLPAPRPTRAPARPAVKAELPLDPYSDAGQNADGGPLDPYAETPVRSVSAAPAFDAGQNADGPAIDVGPAPRAVPATTAPAMIPAAPAAELGDNPYDAPVPSVTAAPVTAAPVTAKPAAKPAATKPARSVSTEGIEGFLPPGTSPDDAAAAKAPAPAVTAPAVPAPAASRPGTPADPYWVDGQTELPPAKPVRVVTAEGPAAPGPAAAPDAPPAPVITPTVLSRSDLNATIGDFNKLAGVLRGSFTPEGARLDAVAEGSVFARAGLRRGDIVTAVDGQPLRSIDDAADLYVRAASTKAANIQLVRAGKPMTLRVLIQ